MITTGVSAMSVLVAATCVFCIEKRERATPKNGPNTEPFMVAVKASRFSAP